MARSITDEPEDQTEKVTLDRLMMALEIIFMKLEEVEAKVDALSVQKGS